MSSKHVKSRRARASTGVVLWVVILVVALAVVLAVVKVVKSASDRPEVETGGPYAFLVIGSSGGHRYEDRSPGFPGKPFPTKVDLDRSATVKPTFEGEEAALGTTVRIRIWGGQQSVNAYFATLAMARISEIEKEMNFYDENSTLSMINAAAGRSAIPVSPDLMKVIKRALKIAELSDGCFDPTVGPLVRLWRQARQIKQLPGPDLLQEYLGVVGYRNVVLDEGALTVKLMKSNMALDLGGIAKGFAVDEAALALKRQGVKSAIVEIGGDLVVFGAKPDGSDYRIEVQNPFQGARSLPVGLVTGTDMAVVTSGNYQQYTVIASKRYSHFIDPRTGKAVPGLASCTVTGPDTMTCDAIATAICIMGNNKGKKFIRKVNQWTSRDR